jgi:hypothetical protein
LQLVEPNQYLDALQTKGLVCYGIHISGQSIFAELAIADAPIPDKSDRQLVKSLERDGEIFHVATPQLEKGINQNVAFQIRNRTEA